MAEFARAALPWILLGLFVGFSCAYMSRKK